MTRRWYDREYERDFDQDLAEDLGTPRLARKWRDYQWRKEEERRGNEKCLERQAWKNLPAYARRDLFEGFTSDERRELDEAVEKQKEQRQKWMEEENAERQAASIYPQKVSAQWRKKVRNMMKNGQPRYIFDSDGNLIGER